MHFEITTGRDHIIEYRDVYSWNVTFKIFRTLLQNIAEAVLQHHKLAQELRQVREHMYIGCHNKVRHVGKHDNERHVDNRIHGRVVVIEWQVHSIHKVVLNIVHERVNVPVKESYWTKEIVMSLPNYFSDSNLQEISRLGGIYYSAQAFETKTNQNFDTTKLFITEIIKCLKCLFIMLLRQTIEYRWRIKYISVLKFTKQTVCMCLISTNSLNYCYSS